MEGVSFSLIRCHSSQSPKFLWRERERERTNKHGEAEQGGGGNGGGPGGAQFGRVRGRRAGRVELDPGEGGCGQAVHRGPLQGSDEAYPRSQAEVKSITTYYHLCSFTI